MPIHDTIQHLIENNPIVLFMKGSEETPMCGFSGTVVQILQGHHVSFHSVNVLEDPAMRQGIKDYSDWPTIPQLYIKGEFIGGCDIVRDMEQSGELKRLLEDKGLVKGA